MTEPISLSFPAPVLWPNKRGHYMAKARATKAHKTEAWAATLDAGWKAPGGPVKLAITVHPKTRHQIDADNAVAAMKAYCDGIALALRVDDRTFLVPDLTFGPPVKGGAVVIRLAVE